jgi:hypothetical protein
MVGTLQEHEPASRERPSLEDVTKQRSEDRDCEHKYVCDTDV